jgi:hypothetical protein
VLKFVEGSTLAELLAASGSPAFGSGQRQPPGTQGLPLADALPIIDQLIDAIEAAHDRNIIHRDLKPANIKITPDRVVKILDFGLAKAMTPDPLGVDVTNSPTLEPVVHGTVQGSILGTAAYMAPQQAKGKPADRRAQPHDCVLRRWRIEDSAGLRRSGTSALFGNGLAFGGSWNADSVILFATEGGALKRTQDSGGAGDEVKKAEPGRLMSRLPKFVPDGRNFFYVRETQGPAELFVASLDNLEGQRLLADRTSADFVPDSVGSSRGHVRLHSSGHADGAAPTTSLCAA